MKPRTIQKAFSSTGLIPFNPARVLESLQSDVQIPSIASQNHPEPLLLPTPTCSREVEQYLAEVQRSDLGTPTRKRVEKIGKVAARSFAEKAILLETNAQLRRSERVRGRAKGDRKVISKARVLTAAVAQELIEAAILREQRQPKARKLRKALPRLGITLGEPVD